MTQEEFVAGDFWTSASAASRYSARPYFHPHVMELARAKMGLESKLEHGVDVGCGTGQSAVALLELAQKVTGVDYSEQMLAHAIQHGGVTYVLGTAEDLPVADNSADIVTVSLAIHWFDAPVFLAEAARVLKPGGWLISYSNSFRARLVGNPAFTNWCHNSYVTRYPTPPRPPFNPPEEAMAESDFDLPGSEEYEDGIVFTPAQLVDYLMTQSNVVAKVEQGEETADSVKEWLTAQVTPLFSGPQATFIFGGAITYARLGI